MKSRYKHNFHKQRQEGWGMNLYRNTRRRYIGGVCAGLADHFEVDAWVVRLVFFASFLFMGSFAVFTYIVLWVALKSNENVEDYQYEYDEHRHQYRPKKMFKYTDSPNVRLKRVRDRMRSTTRRIEEMERYVTSRKFDLDQEFSKIRD